MVIPPEEGTLGDGCRTLKLPAMMDRFDYLADQLIKRRWMLEDALVLDRASPDEGARRREELVARVLVFDAGIGDPETVRMVLDAMPRYTPERRCTGSDCVELARFIRDAIPLGWNPA